MKSRLFTIAVLGLALSFLIPVAANAQERKERTKNRKELKNKKKNKKAKKTKKLYKKNRKKNKKQIAHFNTKRKFKPIRHNGVYEKYYKRKYTSHIHIGAHYARLPKHNHKIKFRNSRYFYSNGYFYTPQLKNRYRVVLPPIGICVNSLPCYDSFYYKRGHKYYTCNNVVYKKHRQHGRPHFKVVGYLRF